MTNNIHDTVVSVHSKRNLYVIIKWIILIASYSFLVYKLLVFHQYVAIISWWNDVPVSYFGWLLAVFLLLPLNWSLESIKWKMLVSKIEKLTFLNAFVSVLAGISSGFFTPNRVGEMVGRVMFLKPENRKSGITLSVINSLTQNLIMILFGVPAFILFLWTQNKSVNFEIFQSIFIFLFFLLVLVVTYFILQSRSFGRSGKWSTKFNTYLGFLSAFSTSDLFRIFSVTAIRYLVFCLQFYFMLRFFGVEISLIHAIIAIPTTYLLVTFTPSMSFSEAAVRSSYAVLIIGVYYSIELPIILAGVSIWFVNFVIPMVGGSLYLVKSKK